jgi:multiple sugar transport system permease protein
LIKQNKLSAVRPYLYFIPAFLFLTIFLFYPLIRQVFIAFQDYQLFKPKNIEFTLINFRKMFTDETLWLTVKNSFEWTAVSLFLQFSIGFAIALQLNKNFPSKTFFRSIIILPWAVPPFITGLLFSWLYHGRVGVINDILIKLSIIERPIAFLADKNIAFFSVIAANVWFGVPFFAIVLLAALQSIPEEVYEAASLDGANPFIRLTKITIPMIKPAILNTILLRTIWIFNFGDLIYVMTRGGPAHRTQIIPTYIMFVAYYENNFGYGAAISLLIMVFLLCYSVIILRFLKQR